MTQLVENAVGNSESTFGRRIELLTVEKLLTLPPPKWLIDGIFEEEAFAVLYGPSGEGKTFVALDWALSVATDRK